MIKIGIVGTGYWGKHHLRVFKKLKCQVVGIYDIDNSKKALADKYEVAFFTDYQKLLNKVDAVSIITPPESHYQLALQALKSEKHVLVEKPFVLKSSQAKILINKASLNKVQLMVGHIYLYHPAVCKLKLIIDNNELGKIYYLISQRLNLGIVRSDVNALWNFAPHDLSVICYLLGENPESVSCFGKAYLQSSVEDVAFLNLIFPNEVIVTLNLSWLHPLKIRQLTVVGDKKMAVFDDTLASNPLKIYNLGVDREKIKRRSSWQTFDEFKMKLRFGDIDIPQIPNNEPLMIEAQDFLDSIKIGKKPKACAIDGYNILCVLEAASKSLKNGGKNVSINY